MTPRARLKKILIVDDDASIREILSTQLSRLHYDTVTAADGHEAVSLFKSQKPDLVLMDLMMPRMDGLEACQKIRLAEKAQKTDRRTPVLFLTARETQHDKLSSALSGGDDFVRKPISLQDLRERVEAALTRAAKK